MKIFLTGATGRVGTRLLPRLVQQGHQVLALVRDPAGTERAKAAGAIGVTGDLLEPGSYTAALGGIDAVVHVAGVLRSTDSDLMFRVNHGATAALAEAALSAGVRRFVFTSTNLVYPGELGRPARETDEPAPAASWGAYPASKVEAENVLNQMHTGRGLGVCTIRLAFVYGEGDPQLAESLRWAGQWPSYQRLQLIHHADAAQAVIRALQAPGIEGRTYNASDDAPVSARELHRLNGVDWQENGASGADLWYGITDSSLIRAELGFRPLYPSVWSARDAGAL